MSKIKKEEKLSLKPLFLLVGAAVLFLVIDCGEAASQEVVIKLKPQEKFQVMSGWEATAQAGQIDSAAFENYKTELFDRAVNDLGINRLRLEIRSGAENPRDFFTAFATKQINSDQWQKHFYEVINDNDDPFVINPDGFNFSEIDSQIESIVLPVKKLLQMRGEALFVNLNFVDFPRGRGESNLRHSAAAEEYAELILAAYLHMNDKYGFVPDAVEVILEPDNKTGWSGTDIGKAVAATAKRLQAGGFKPAFIVPSTTNAANAPIFIDEIARVPGAMEYVTEFSYHRYCCASEKVLRQISERAEKYGKRTAMLERIGADYETLHEDLKIGRNSAWQQYTLAFVKVPDNGAQYYVVDDAQKNDPKFSLGSRTKFLRQYFRYIRAGAQRIGAEASNKNFDPLAFINPDGKTVVVIKADVPGRISVEDLPAGKYGISYATSKGAEDGGLPDFSVKKGEPLSTSIPSAGVITIYEKSSL